MYHLVRRDLNAVFRSTERTGTTEKHALWTRSALVVCQVSLAFVLLIGSGLLTLSFARLLAVDPGFQAQNVQTAEFSLPMVRYKEDSQLRNFIGGLLARVRAIPGVVAAGATDALPFSDRNNASAMAVEGYNPATGELPPVPRWSTIDAGYLAAMKIPLRAGRYFREGDTADGQKVAIVDEFMARKYWPAGKAVGGHIFRGIDPKYGVYTVIGVVGSVKSEDMADLSQRGDVYWNYKQFGPRSMHVVVKTAASDVQAVSAVRAALKQADPELPLFDVKTMPERVTNSVSDRKAAMVICLVFARAGTGAFGDRHLRSAGLHGDAAHARVRNPYGAGRERGRRGGDGDAARAAPGGDWTRDRCGGSTSDHAADDYHAVRSPADRSAGVWKRGGGADGGGGGSFGNSFAAYRADSAGERAAV